MPTLRSTLSVLAASFADSVLAAIRGSSLEELLAEGGSGGVGNGRRARAGGGGGGQPDPLRGARKTRSGRLKRRSSADIAKALDRVVALVKSKKEGLRAERIRFQLQMQSKEMPRILREGLAKKKLKSRGQKRATTYSAA